MSNEVHAQLERSLRELTAWAGPTGERWRAALESSDSRHGSLKARIWHLINQPGAQLAAACVAVIAIGLAIATNLPRVDVTGTTVPNALSIGQSMHVYTSDDAAWSPQVQYDSSARFMSPSSDGTVDDLRAGPDAWQYAWDYAWQSKSVASSEEADADVRQVVRKATIELKTTDVRAVFLKAGHLVEEAMGEFVQDSALTGTDQQMQANLTLRVDAQRLPELLNELRGLAEVVSERVGGQDVTSQVVDLEARLRNETRVEQELLELMDKRADAPLKEVLELRSHLSNVRQSIEQLTAQRDHLGRLVSLATVLVIIRGAQAEPPKPDGSIGAYFFERMRAAWLRALVFLVDTAATIVSVLVGGILWWVLLVAAIVGLRRYLRRRAHQV